MTTPEKGPQNSKQPSNEKEENYPKLPEQKKENNEEGKELPSFMFEAESAGRKDREELEEFIKKTQSEILLNILAGGNEKLGVDDIKRHDTEFAPRKMTKI